MIEANAIWTDKERFLGEAGSGQPSSPMRVKPKLPIVRWSWS